MVFAYLILFGVFALRFGEATPGECNYKIEYNDQ